MRFETAIVLASSPLSLLLLLLLNKEMVVSDARPVAGSPGADLATLRVLRGSA